MAQQYGSKKLEQLEKQAQMLDYARYLRYLFYFYSFISFVFWFLNCFEVDWLYRFNWLFIGPFNMVRKFYKPEGISSVDFSIAIIGGASLIMGVAYDFITNKMLDRNIDLQDKEEIRLEQKRMKMQIQKRVAKSVGDYNQGDSVEFIKKNPFEDSKLLFLIQPHINKIKKKETDIELTFQEVELWKQRIDKKILAGTNYSNPLQKGYYRKNLFFLYSDFNYVDDFLYYIKPTMDSIKLEFKNLGIRTNFSFVFSAITNMEALEKELDLMDTILSLNFRNEYITTNRFKVTYDNKPIKKYEMKLKGEYNLSKNLTVNNRQPIYSLIETKIGEDDNENESN